MHTVDNCWKDIDLKILNDNYSLIGARGIVEKKLLSRSVGAIREKANKLGLKIDRRLYYNDNWKVVESNPYLMLLDTELSYIAGIIDGEGWFGLVNNSWSVGVGNTNKELIFWLHDKVLYSNIRLAKSKNIKWKDCWTWMLSGNIKVEALLKLLFPFMIVRKDKVITVLNSIRELTNDL